MRGAEGGIGLGVADLGRRIGALLLYACGAIQAAEAAPPPGANDPVLAAHNETRTAATPTVRGHWLDALPLVFEPVSGQGPNHTSFRARGPGYGLALDRGTAYLTPNFAASRDTHGLRNAAQAPTVSIGLVGASPSLGVGLKPLAARANYFKGSDPTRWRTGVPLFERVRYADVYPGIDLEYYGQSGTIEHDFIVAPGADPSAIVIAFGGTDSVTLSGEGELRIVSEGTSVVLRKPVAYQGEGSARREIASSYVVREGNRVAFHLGEYDPSQRLVIDPVISYSTYLGGSANFDNGAAVEYGPGGTVYVLGTTSSFPATAGAYDTAPSGIDCFVAKLNPSLTGAASLVYATYLGGTASEGAGGLAVDAQGNAYVALTTNSGFPTTSGAHDTTHNGLTDAAVAKISPTGSGLIWSTYLGGDFNDGASGIAVDLSGAVVVVGGTDSLNFPVSVTAFQKTKRGANDGFMTVINPTGGGLIYSTYFGGTGAYDNLSGVAIDGLARIYVSGTTLSADMPTVAGAFDTTLGGAQDAFAARFDIALPGVASLAWATFLGGSGGTESGAGIGLAPGDQPIVYGYTDSSDFPAVNTGYDSTLGSGGIDEFIVRLSNDGTTALWASYLGGTGSDSGGSDSLAVDAFGRAHVAGLAGAADFPTTGDAVSVCGANSASYSVLDTTVTGAGALITSGCLAPSWNLGIGVDACRHAAMTGFTTSASFPTVNGYSPAQPGLRDAYLLEVFSSSGGGQADLALTVSDAPDPVFVGQPVTYTIQVTNNGPSSATGVRLVHTMSVLVDAQSLPAECTASGSFVTCDLGTIASGATVPVSFEASPPIPGSLHAKTTVSPTNDDLVCSNNTATTLTIVKDPTLNLDDPNGGEFLATGSNTSIEWTAPASAATFKLYYSVDGGSTWVGIASGVGGRSYGWQVPTVKGNKPKAKVKIRAFTALNAPAGTDTSDATFTIEVLKLNQPNGSESLSSGSPYTITWTTNATASPVTKTKLFYTLNGGKVWKPITTLNGNPGSYDWTIPTVPGIKANCKVRVLLKDGANVTQGKDDSNAPFTITP